VCVTVIKTGSAGLIAYRLMSRDSEWVWLQTSARVVYKNSKPEFIIAIHRYLTYVEQSIKPSNSFLLSYNRNYSWCSDRLCVSESVFWRHPV